MEENQDGIGLVKLLRLVCTKKGSGPKLTMLELALAWTDLLRLWQDGRTLEAYQREMFFCPVWEFFQRLPLEYLQPCHQNNFLIFLAQ